VAALGRRRKQRKTKRVTIPDRGALSDDQLLPVAVRGADARRRKISAVRQISGVRHDRELPDFHHAAHDGDNPCRAQGHGRPATPVLGNYGVMSAKNGGINVMIVTTILSFIWYQRGNKIPTVSWAKFGNIVMGTFFALAYVNIIWLAVYG
jgi:hypothetical protein